MGDKSPKSKQRGKKQKDVAAAQAKTNQDKRQAAFSSGPGKEKKK